VLRLAPPQTTESIALDQRRLRSQADPVAELAPFVRWDDFRERIRFRQGEHITIVGTTGSGKTVLGRELVQNIDYTAVLGTKNEDTELYKPFEDRGFEITDNFDPHPDRDESKIIFRPRLSRPDQKGLDAQHDAFEGMLFEVHEYGGWELYADEIWYLTKRLKLSVIFETLWSTGRSNHVTVVCATQLPVDIPLMAFDQATHLFLFRNSDRYRINRMAEFAGADVTLLRELIPILPRHEFVYVDTREGTVLRSKVILHAH
jgi:hypothetical protein